MKRIGILILTFCLIFLSAHESIIYPSKARNMKSQDLDSKSFVPQETESKWEFIGPEGGEIVGLAVDPHNNKGIYALAYGFPRQLYRSINSGQSWERLGTIDGYCFDLALDPINPNIIYAGGSYEIFKSIDNGYSWNKYKLPDDFYGNGINLAPNDPSIIYIQGYQNIYFNTSWKRCMAVCKSIDGGETWDLKKINPTSSLGHVECMAISPLYPNIIYAGGNYRDNDTTYYKLFRSYDGGENWEDITGIIERQPYSILINPLNPSNIYVGTSRGIYRSFDGGNTWLENSGYARAYQLAIDPLYSNIIYAGAYKDFYKSEDGGVNWIRYDLSIYGPCRCLLTLSSSPTTVLFGSTSGIYKSENGGISWEESHTGMSTLRITAFTFATSSPNVIYASSTYSLYKTNDFGISWIKLHDWGGWKSLFVNPHDVNELFGINWDSIYRSTDGGSSWTRIYRAFSLNDFVINKNNLKFIFSGGSSEEEEHHPMALGISTDGGANWTTYNITSTDGEARAVASDLINDYIYVGGRFFDNQKWREALFKSSDGGENWINIGEEIDDTIYDIAIDPVSSKKIFVGTWGGVYQSEDYGVTWAAPPSYLRINHISINPNFPNDIFMAGIDGVYFSNDGGRSWLEFSKGLAVSDIECLDIGSQSKYLYAGTDGGSVYRYDLSNFKTLTISSGSGGTTAPAPGSYHYAPGTEVTVTAIPDSGYGFTYWGGDITGTDSQITVAMDSDKSIKANFLSYTLTISATLGGTTDPAPGIYRYAPGTEVTVTAIPDSWYGFKSWSGDLSGTHNPVTLTIDLNKSINANFVRIYPPLNFVVEKVVNRSVLGIEYINVLSWQSNPNNEGIVKYRIYLFNGSIKSLLEELDTNRFKYLHRKVEKEKQYRYAIMAVYVDGREGEPTYITVN